jgi:hypothetical protein
MKMILLLSDSMQYSTIKNTGSAGFKKQMTELLRKYSETTSKNAIMK